jgi:hypothetical protein
LVDKKIGAYAVFSPVHRVTHTSHHDSGKCDSPLKWLSDMGITNNKGS